MTDPGPCATMDVLTVLSVAGLVHRLKICSVLSSVGWRPSAWSMATATDHVSPYAWLGGVLGTYFGEYQAGFRFGRLGLDLVEKHGLDRFQRPRLPGLCGPRRSTGRSPANVRAFLQARLRGGAGAGDLSYAAYSCIDLITNRSRRRRFAQRRRARGRAMGSRFVRGVRFGLAVDSHRGSSGLFACFVDGRRISLLR